MTKREEMNITLCVTIQNKGFKEQRQGNMRRTECLHIFFLVLGSNKLD